MVTDEDIKRINELYHKSKAEGLTDEEKEEQQRLRKAYVDAIKGNLKANLDNIVIERPDGTKEKLKKKQRLLQYFCRIKTHFYKAFLVEWENQM